MKLSTEENAILQLMLTSYGWRKYWTAANVCNRARFFSVTHCLHKISNKPEIIHEILIGLHSRFSFVKHPENKNFHDNYNKSCFYIDALKLFDLWWTLSIKSEAPDIMVSKDDYVDLMEKAGMI